MSPEDKTRWDREQRARDLDRSVRTSLPEPDLGFIRSEFARRHAEQIAWEAKLDEFLGETGA